FFPPLSGRLHVAKNDDDTSSFYINCNDSGALFTHAAALGVHVRDVADSVHVPIIVRSFFSLNGALNIEGVSNPLLGVQVTELEDGLFVACTMNHCVADGTSFWHFFNFWSEISRGGSGQISKFPSFDRSFVRRYTENCVVSVTDQSFEQNFKNNKTPPPPPLLERVFRFDKESIAKLKAKANSEATTNK
ncbi:acyltransferase, partial [Acinetobacter baumannii]